MKLLSELKVKLGYRAEDIFHAIKKKYGIFKDEILDYEIIKESLDARKKPDVFVVLSVAVKLSKSAEKKTKNLKDIEIDHSGVNPDKVDLNLNQDNRPVVVGFGPSGMFAGLTLALAGLKPIIIEQGKCVEDRQKDIDEFWNNRKLNKYSNVQFGEGGAGTFSDGKLASNVNNSYTKKCINEFILNGADKEIFYSYAPHIGSDKLKVIVKNFRNKIIENGGEVLFNTHFDGYSETNGKISEVYVSNTLTGNSKTIKTNALILAVGHSAIDVYKFLKSKNLVMKQKPFAMGVRIEQNQAEINFAQYGLNENGLPAANYKLVSHLKNGRSVFTFCMCPGGYVVASSSEEGTVVTNGMSDSARDGKNANSAVLVNVTPEDFESDDILAGAEFQRKYEKLAFELGGRNYDAPAERVKDFMLGKTEFDELSKTALNQPTYKPSVKLADLSKCLPDFVTESLKLALPEFNKKVKGFADDENLLIGVESRSSAPVQIVRDENTMTKTVGLFVCGEGAGYAGGITSSAADGLKCGEAVIDFYCKNNINQIK